jgi:Polysaccharide deacetylase
MQPVELDKGYFLISFDFELAWGTRGRPSSKTVGPYLDGTRRAIDGVLRLLEKYELQATWVAVGALFLGGPERHEWLRDAKFDDVPHGDCLTQPHWYAEDVLSKLSNARPVQEIGCHTLTHMYVEDSKESREQLDLELERFLQLFQQLKLPTPKSFIFPKHYMAHFDLLRKHQLTNYRGSESGWFEQLPNATLRAAGRLAWARLRFPPVTSLPARSPEGLWMIPSSQYFSGFQNVGKYITVADRISKGIQGLNRAARRNQVHHLWTHPFNLGVRTDELLFGLEKIFRHARDLCSKGRLVNLTMERFAEELSKGHASQSPIA